MDFDSDFPECETCGKIDCPDAELPSFSEPRDCEYAAIYHALRDAKDCDYGCARDYTNQAIRLWVVEAVEGIVTKAKAEAWDEGYKQGGPMHDVNYDDPDAHTRNPYR